MALSAAVYSDFPTGDNPETSQPWTIADLILKDKVKDYKDNEGVVSSQFTSLASLGGWQLISFQPNTTTGFSGAAFRSSTGEIVFAFRGTEPGTLLNPGPDITGPDLAIAVQGAMDKLPAQFSDAQGFVSSVLASHSGAAYSFTGHSLGGAIASYMTHVTNTDSIAGVGKAVTFNAPGIAGLLPGVNPADYNGLITDHVNEGDIIGEFKNNQQLGRTEYHKSKLAGLNEDNASAVLSDIIALHNPSMSVLDKLRLLSDNNGNVLNMFDNGARNPLDYHDMGDMIENGQMTGSASYSGVADLANVVGTVTETVGHLAAAAILIYETEKLALVTVNNVVGGIVYYSAEGVARFINTSGLIITKLAYYGADGVERFIDTSSYVLGGIGHYAIQGVSEFFETTGNILGEGIWNMSVFARDSFTSALDGIFGLFNSAATTTVPFWIDPLILDIDGDGIETTNLVGSSAYFDLDVNGFAERTGWVSADDGLLVLDRNNNGTIDNGQELFGDRTLLQNGTTAATGF